jgi:hypothetical protein
VEFDERRLGGLLREMEMAKICWMCRWTGMTKTSRQLGMSVGVLVPAEGKGNDAAAEASGDPIGAEMFVFFAHV